MIVLYYDYDTYCVILVISLCRCLQYHSRVFAIFQVYESVLVVNHEKDSPSGVAFFSVLLIRFVVVYFKINMADFLIHNCHYDSRDIEYFHCHSWSSIIALILHQASLQTEDLDMYCLSCVFVASHLDTGDLLAIPESAGLLADITEQRRLEKLRSMRALKVLAEQCQFDIKLLDGATKDGANWEQDMVINPDLDHRTEIVNLEESFIGISQTLNEGEGISGNTVTTVTISESTGTDVKVDGGFLSPSIPARVGNSRSNKALVDPLSSSVISEVLKSVDDENIAQYGMRAYMVRNLSLSYCILLLFFHFINCMWLLFKTGYQTKSFRQP